MGSLNTFIRLMRRSGWYLLADAVVVVIAYRAALPLRFAGYAGEPYSISPIVQNYWFENLRLLLPAIVVVHLIANIWAGLYSRLWRFASAPDVLIISQAWLAATLPISLLDLLWPVQIRLIPITAVLLGGFLSLSGFTLVRYRSRLFRGAMFRLGRWLGRRGEIQHGRTRVLIIGAGETGQTLSWQLQNRARGEGYQVVGFVDDDPDKLGLNVHGSPVLGGRAQIPEIVVGHGVDLIILAIHAVRREEFREIINTCQAAPAQIKIIPDVFESLAENSHVPLVRDVTVQDFLGRTSTEIDLESCRTVLHGKVVLVTGGAGSIGSELCRQILSFSPESVIAVDVSESGLYELHEQIRLQRQADGVQIRIADVTDESEMAALFAECLPDVVFHAAAYKHVPLMETHPRAALRTNVLGTLRVGRIAIKMGAERFVFISTDKAVNPSSVMGATKMLGEKVVAALAAESEATQFAAVRFGNVLASRGSVVPVFDQQIEAGGPVTVTHPEITRFFMTLPEAVRLVIQAAALTGGSDLFMLDMGERIKILNLAERMIRLRGLRPEVDIPIIFTGLRPGEKLHEQLMEDQETSEPTVHPQIYRILDQEDETTIVSLEKLTTWIRGIEHLTDFELGEALRQYSQ